MTLLLDFFSSIRLGIFLMVLIFVYSSIGSAGIPYRMTLNPASILEPASWVNVREFIEMSEFQWFHWWPFDLMIALFCINLTVATIRRIPFNVLTLGVWTIHAGLIILAIGSVVYFTLKREGDTPVPRRQVIVNLDGVEPTSLVASPGNATIVGDGANQRTIRIQQITPDWELLSGDDAGKYAYKVTVGVYDRNDDLLFMRELLDGYPQYTEDLVRDMSGAQPFVRSVNVNDGQRLVDESIALSLDTVSVDHFWLMESRALYVREKGSTEWIERPVPWMPLFQDHLESHDNVWPSTDAYAPLPELKPAGVTVKADVEADPLPDVNIEIRDYLRYAVLQPRRLRGGDTLAPGLRIQMTGADGRPRPFELAALDASQPSPDAGAIEASRALQGGIRFLWAPDEALAQRLLNPRSAAIVERTGDAETRIGIDAIAQADPGLAYRPVAGTPYSWRVQSFQDGLEIGGRVSSVAIIDVRRELEDGSVEEFTRWVFDDPALTRDVPDGEMLSDHTVGDWDRTLDLTYQPGDGVAIRFVAGPDVETLRVSIPQRNGGVQINDVLGRQQVVVSEQISIFVDEYEAFTREETRPLVIPEPQRDRDIGMMASMVRVEIPGPVAGGPPVFEAWLPYHRYIFDRPEEAIRRFRYEPTEFTMPDGRVMEIAFSRQREPLDNPVRLDDFEIVSRIGGFDDTTSSIRDWQSVVRFDEPESDESSAWTDPVTVSVNNPKPSGQYWFFQAQWDPPDRNPRFEGDPGSNGLNYTVLGVGNRHGVYIQLWGTVITCIGMGYAFYVKPWIKRRRAAAVHASLATAGAGAMADSGDAGGRGADDSNAEVDADTDTDAGAVAAGQGASR